MGATADAQKDARTLFVRGVSFGVDEAGLEQVFSAVGPIKQCFLVRQKGDAHHKGFGFVQFALQEDAARAVQELNGHAIAGRKLLVEVANKRAPLLERKRKRTDVQEDAAEPTGQETQQKKGPPKSDKQAHPKQDDQSTAKRQKQQKQAPAAAGAAVKAPASSIGQQKHVLMRTVALGCLTPEAAPQAIALADKAGKVVDVVNPAPQDVVDKAHLAADGCSGTVVLVTYESVQDAMTAVTKLHGVKLKLGRTDEGAKGKKQQKPKEGGASEVPVQVWARQVSGEGAHVRKWRVIVRNLPFKVTEAHIRTALAPAGFAWEVSLPRNPDGRIKGFAFAAFTLRGHAEKAIKLVNGTEILGRPVAVDWALPKAQYQAATKQQHHTARSPSPAPADEAFQGEGEEGEGEEQVASDEGEMDAIDGEGDGSDDDVAGDEDDMGTASSSASAGDDDDLQGDEDEEDEEGLDGEQGGGEDKFAEERNMLSKVLEGLLGDEQGPAAGAGRDEEEPPGADGQQAAAGKGKGNMQQEAQAVVRAKEAEGKGTGRGEASEADKQQQKQQDGQEEGGQQQQPRPAGQGAVSRTVFVRGLPLDVTQMALQLKMEAYGRVKACRLVVDKASGKPKGTAFVEFQSEEGAKKAAGACARGRQNKGPGVVVGGRQLDVDLALAQESARQLAANKAKDKDSRKDKRHLYLAKEGEITEGSAAWAGMSEHDREKRRRALEEKRTKLKSPNFVISPTRLSIRNIPFSMTEPQLRALAVRAVKERASKEKPVVTQVKILREAEGGKLDASGKPRSKGMGFVEFSEHDHAVACLRQLNNNPAAFTNERRPIIEFAIENVKVLKKLEAIQAKRLKMQQQQQQGGSSKSHAAAAGGRAGGEGKPGSDGQQQEGQEGEGGEGPAPERVLSLREKRKLRAKAKVERRKQRKKEQQAAQGGAEQQQQPPAPQPNEQPSTPAASQKQKSKNFRKDAQQQPGLTSLARSPKPQLKPDNQMGAATGKRARGGDDELERVLQEAADDGGRGPPQRRKRRGLDAEKTDRLDKLAERHVARVTGERPLKRAKQLPAKQQGVAGQKQQQPSSKQAASKAALPAVELGLSAGSLKRWFDDS